MKLIFILIALFLSLDTSVLCQLIETDRPDQTESSTVVPSRTLQIESGFLHSITEIQNINVEQTLLPTTLFRLGFSDVFELRILSQFESSNHQFGRTNGISDLEVGTKIRLYDRENSKTKAAFITHLSLPTGSTGITNSDFGSLSKLSISHDLNDNLALGYNLGYNYFGYGSGDMFYSIAIGYSVHKRVGVYIEPYGQVVQLNKWISNLDAGFTYLIKDNLQFDFSFGMGLNQRMNYLSIGMSWLSLSKD